MHRGGGVLEDEHGAVVVAAADLADDPLGRPVEARGDRLERLALEPGDALVEVGVPGLDHTVGVEEQRVAGGEPAVGHGSSGSGMMPSAVPRASSTDHAPWPRPHQRGRVAGAGELVVAGLEVDAGRAPPSRRSRRSAGAAGSRWRRRRARAGEGADQPTEGTAELERPGGGADALAAHVDEDQLEVPARRCGRWRPGSRRRTRRRSRPASPTASASPPAARDGALRLQPVAQVGEHRLAHRAGQAALLAAGGSRGSGASETSRMTQAVTSAASSAASSSTAVNAAVADHDREHHERPEPQQQHAEQQPDVVGAHRHQRRRPAPRRTKQSETPSSSAGGSCAWLWGLPVRQVAIGSST